MKLLVIVSIVAGCSSGSPSGSGPGSGSTADAPPPPSDAGTAPQGDDPVEPVWPPDQVVARVKSPGEQMHFTAGLPFRILADGNDPLAYQCPPGHPPYACPDSSMAFLVDGRAVGTIPVDPANQNLWELRLPAGLPAGDHTITVRFTPHDAPAVDGLVPVYIHVDPMPAHANTVELSSDLVLSGNTDLDWTDTVVKGNGHTVTAAPGYAGNIIIHGSFITGLASFDEKIGIDATTTGSIDISGSIFEATAPLRLAANGTAPVHLTSNEFRSTNYVTYVSSDPNRSPILELSGTTSGSKVMQGNNIGAGIVLITNMAGWQIGGLHDAESNIFVGPRCVLQLVGSPGAVIQGNYLRHDYYGGFSQGFNLQLDGNSTDALAEHNVIRDSSWPLQGFGGELRYNLMINSGHDFVRSSQSGTKFHHNIFAHAQAPNSAYDGAVYIYGGEQGLVFEHNTIDAGGDVGKYDGPAIRLGAGVTMTSLRDNAFTQFADGSQALVTGAVTNADYNAWYNPLASHTAHYASGIAGGSHDVSGDPQFSGTVPEVPYQIDEGCVWSRTIGVSQVLGHYRTLYTPRAGSPLVGADATNIGAIGAGDPDDKFGLVMQRN
jgi:hypothetical protein